MFVATLIPKGTQFALFQSQVEVRSTTTYDDDHGVAVELFSHRGGDFKLCASKKGDSSDVSDFSAYIASVSFMLPNCRFEDTPASPCHMQHCQGDDAFSDACLEFTQEYCTSQPYDSGCALFLPLYVRVADERSALSLSVKGVVLQEEIRFVSSACTCDGECKKTDSAGVDLLSYAAGASLINLEFIARGVGEVKVCAVKTHVANVQIVAPECAFDASIEDTPCNVKVCADPTSEECMYECSGRVTAPPNEIPAACVEKGIRIVLIHDSHVSSVC